MTLDQLIADLPTAAELKSLWLVFDARIAGRLQEVQPIYQHQVSPVALTDGRFAVCADLLTEIDGIFSPTFATLDQSEFPFVQVLQQSEIINLFPVSTEP